MQYTFSSALCYKSLLQASPFVLQSYFLFCFPWSTSCDFLLWNFGLPDHSGKMKESQTQRTYVEVVSKTWPWRNKITAQLFAQYMPCQSSRVSPMFQNMSTPQKASLSYMVICLTTNNWKVIAELRTSDLVRDRKNIRTIDRSNAILQVYSTNCFGLSGICSVAISTAASDC